MKRRAFIQTASLSTLGLLTRAASGQTQDQTKIQPKGPVQPATRAQVPSQRTITRIQQLAEGGS